MKHVRNFGIILVLVLAILGGVFLFSNFVGEDLKPDKEAKVTLDEVVILEKIQKLSRLETVSEVYQRDVEIEIDLGGLEIAGATLLQNRRNQEFSITGEVIAGVDLSKLDATSVTMEEREVGEGEEALTESFITINLPAPELFSASLNSDKLKLIRDDVSLLFSLETINSNRREELNEFAYQQVVKQGQQAVIVSSCENDILNRANEYAVESVRNLFSLTDIKPDNIIVNTSEPGECKL